MANTTGTLSATGSVTLTKLAAETLAQFQVSGTYSLSFLFEGSIDGTNFFPVSAVDVGTGAVVTGTQTPAANTVGLYDVPAAGLSQVRVRCTAYTSGTLAVAAQSAAYVDLPDRGTYVSGGTYSGVTLAGANTVTGSLLFADAATLAAAGSVQGDAAAVANFVTYVTAADGTKGVVLPTAATGLVRFVYNTHATNGLKVYPNTSDDINDGTTNAAVTIEGKTLAIFLALDATTWAAIYTVNT